jgi:hypothetical protein
MQDFAPFTAELRGAFRQSCLLLLPLNGQHQQVDCFARAELVNPLFGMKPLKGHFMLWRDKIRLRNLLEEPCWLLTDFFLFLPLTVGLYN